MVLSQKMQLGFLHLNSFKGITGCFEKLPYNLVQIASRFYTQFSVHPKFWASQDFYTMAFLQTFLANFIVGASQVKQC